MTRCLNGKKKVRHLFLWPEPSTSQLQTKMQRQVDSLKIKMPSKNDAPSSDDDDDDDVEIR